MSSAVAAGGVLLLAVLAPFEMSTPLVRLPGQSLSNLEAALLVACLAWSAAVVWTARWQRWRPWRPWRLSPVPLAAVWTAFVVAMAIAAASASDQRANASHMVGRFAAAGAVYLLAVEGLTTSRRLRFALTVCAGSGVVVAVLAILEYRHVPAVLSLLRLFRPGVTAVGAQVRAGGSLQYPTIASMYLEVVFAFGVGLMFAAIDAPRRASAAAWFAALVIVGEAITLTFTRAGLITMATTLVCAGLWRWKARGFDRGTVAVVSLAGAIGVMFFVSRPAQSLWLRMTSEGQDDWYRASVAAPSSVTFAANAPQYVPVQITNAGRVQWDSADAPPIFFSYHWLDGEGQRVVSWEGERTRFAEPIPPGSTAGVIALVRGPREPGRYALEWDVVQEGRLWFSTEQNAPDPMVSQAVVTGSATGAPLVTTARPRRAVRPGRMVLWRTALQMIAAHPWLGVGPDNFRLLYGSYAGLPGADPRTHTNNMYLEVLVGGGALAFALFILFAAKASMLFAFGIGHAQACPASVRPLAVGIAAAGIAIGLHALVDSFLSFAPTYILFALTLGFAAVVARGMETSADAHRV